MKACDFFSVKIVIRLIRVLKERDFMFKKGLLVVLVMACLTVIVAGSAFAASISIATGGTGGTYYPIGGAIAAAASKMPGLNVTAETANAAVANTNLITEGEIEIAFSQADVTAWAYNGEVMFEGRPLKNIRTIAALYPETLQLVISKSAGINSLEDLKGKRVCVGAPGSGTEGDVRAIFNAVGIKYEDMKVDFLDYNGLSNRFKDNQLDAGFLVSGVPTSALMDLTTVKDVALLNFDNEMMDKLIKAVPFFIPNVIPAGTYRGIDTDINTPAVMAILITNDMMPEDVIYNFTKGMFDNIEDIHAAHAMARNIKLETATKGLTAPMHPGAAKYYKEKGIDFE